VGAVVVLAGLVRLPGDSAAIAGNFNSIDQVRPRIGERGKTVEVTINGSYLVGAEEIVFYRPGIRAVSIEPIGKAPDKPVPHWPNLKCVFEIASDCPVGEHVFRVRTRSTLSMAATFNVTPFPVVDEIEDDPQRGTKGNGSPVTAMPLQPNVTVHAFMDSQEDGDVDLYRVPVTPGDRLTAEVGCVRISDFTHGHGEDSGYDLKLRVVDAAGRQLAANDDDGSSLDSLLTFRASTAGTYYVGISGYGNSGYNPTRAGSGRAGSTGDYQARFALTGATARGGVRIAGFRDTSTAARASAFAIYGANWSAAVPAAPATAARPRRR